MRILLTGASGYLGLHIVSELIARDHKVTAITRAPEKMRYFTNLSRLEIIKADLENITNIEDLIANHEVLIHAALIWGDEESEIEALDTNFSSRLFDAAGKAGLKRLLYVSSTAVHRPFTRGMSENDVLVTEDLYGATKAAGELFLHAACARHNMTGIVVRPGPLVGPPAFNSGSFRSPERLLNIVKDAIAGVSISVREKSGRQFSDVKLIAKIIGILTEIENPMMRYICVDHRLLTWEWIANMVIEYINSKSRVEVNDVNINDPFHCFSTERIEQLLGRSMDAKKALIDHVYYLTQSTELARSD